MTGAVSLCETGHFGYPISYFMTWAYPVMRRINSDILIAIFLLISCGVLFHDTFSFRETPLAIIKSSVWPRVVLGLLFIFSFIYLLQSIRSDTSSLKRKPIDPTGWIQANQNIFWCYGLFALFLITLPWFGMLIGGGLFVFAVLTAMGPNEIRSHLINAIIALLAMGVMWALFTFGLNVILPQGEIFRVF